MAFEPVNTAVIGCGMISEIYVQNMVEKFSILHVQACCDQDAGKAASMAERYGLAAMTLDEIIENPSIELVVNLTGPRAHFPTNKRLLEAGKHVYSEKTLTVALADAEELVRLAGSAGSPSELRRTPSSALSSRMPGS